MPVNLGARAIALSLVIWHLGSDNDTGMMSIGCYDLLLEEVSQRIKRRRHQIQFSWSDVVAAVEVLQSRPNTTSSIASTTTVISCKECAP